VKRLAVACTVLNVELELVINACYAISLLIVAGSYRVVTSCTQAELTHNWLLTARSFFKYAVISSILNGIFLLAYHRPKVRYGTNVDHSQQLCEIFEPY